MAENKIKKPKRLNTQLEATGAEHLVLGELLRRRIQAFITPQNFESYDIVATNPEKKSKLVKIQVKSRFKSTDWSFPIHKEDTDFVIFFKLNIKKNSDKLDYDYSESSRIFIFPIKVVLENRAKDGWHKVSIKKIPQFEKYEDNWNLIKKKLQMK